MGVGGVRLRPPGQRDPGRPELAFRLRPAGLRRARVAGRNGQVPRGRAQAWPRRDARDHGHALRRGLASHVVAPSNVPAIFAFQGTLQQSSILAPVLLAIGAVETASFPGWEPTDFKMKDGYVPGSYANIEGL